MEIQKLLAKWNKEKNSYATKEVGSGVQKFVKDVLKSKYIFVKEFQSFLLRRVKARRMWFLRNDNEKGILLGIKAIKEFVRVPKINEKNQHIKDEIIKMAQAMLDLEEKTLGDLVDFGKVMVQKFDRVRVEGNHLILEKDGQKIKTAIRKNSDLVAKTINAKFGDQGLGFRSQTINLAELKTMVAVDFDLQKKIKDYLDDLVFALYFNVLMKKIGLVEAPKIKIECAKNPHYGLLAGA